MRLSLTSVAAALLFFPLFLQSTEENESQTERLKYEVVVTATRIETPAREVASSITVITREDLERMGKTNLVDALRLVPSVEVIQNGPAGGAASVFLRGANSEHTLVLMDGVELNDPISPSRSFDLAHMTLENIDRIEILRGPQSTLYGSDALGGVINIITRKGEGKPEFSLSLYGGSYSTLAGDFGLRGSTGSFHYSLSGSTFQNEGVSAADSYLEGNTERDGYKNVSLQARVSVMPLPNLEAELIAKHIHADIDIDSFGGSHGDDPNSIQKNDSVFIKAMVRTLWMKNRWEQKFSVSLVNNTRRNQNPRDSVHPFESENGRFQSRLLHIDWQNTLFLHKDNALTFGIDHQKEQGESDYTSESTWGIYESLFPLKKAATTGFYVQDQIRVSSRFFATAGLRLDEHSQSGRALTYRLAPAYILEKTGTKFKATFGTGFKSPSLYQLYAPGTFLGLIGNDNLRPEQSTGWDAGIEQKLSGETLRLDVTYFFQKYKDLIEFDFVQGFINIGRAESRGAEIMLLARPSADWLLSGTYTLTEAKNKVTNTALLRRPRHKFTASLNHKFLRKGNLNLSFLYTGEREDMDFSTWPAGRVTMPAYVLLKAAASFDLSHRIQLFCRLDNILDTKYEMVKGYGVPGFSVFLGTKIQF